jgi:hypothetical protein
VLVALLNDRETQARLWCWTCGYAGQRADSQQRCRWRSQPSTDARRYVVAGAPSPIERLRLQPCAASVVYHWANRMRDDQALGLQALLKHLTHQWATHPEASDIGHVRYR